MWHLKKMGCVFKKTGEGCRSIEVTRERIVPRSNKAFECRSVSGERWQCRGEGRGGERRNGEREWREMRPVRETGGLAE